MAAIAALSCYNVAGFRENAIATMSCCGLCENRNCERLTYREISLHRSCCVVSLQKGWIWREIALTTFRVHWFILKERKPGQVWIQVVSAVCAAHQFRVVLGLRTSFLALLKLALRILCLHSEIAERWSFSAMIEQSRGSFRFKVPMKEMTDVWACGSWTNWAHVPF